MANQKAKASTQAHLDIEDIVDDMVIFKTGWIGIVLNVNAVNFDLLSETEQDATIYSYGAFLNSLTFPVQILVRSKKADITAYFSALSEAENSQPNPDLKRQIQKYRDFIESIVQQKTVLDKKFYFIVNYSPLEMGVKRIGKTNTTKTNNKMQLIADAKASLDPKRDHITKQMSRLGLIVNQLTTKELIELYYDIYNPAPTGTQRVILDTNSYTTPIVKPAVGLPTESQNTQEQQSQPQISQGQPQPQHQEQPQVIAQGNQALRAVPQQNARPLGPDPTLSTTNPPQPQQESVPPRPQSQLSANQQEALSGLQDISARASQMVNQRQQTQPATQTNGIGESK